MKNSGVPAVSVIIPTYNTSQYIREALDSVFAQTFKDYEIIVINDGSPDTEILEQILCDYQGRIVYFKKENGGVASARNAGISLARGKYLAMLDSDDIWLPEYLEKQVSSLAAGLDIAASYTNAMIFGDSPLAGKDFMSIFPSEGEVTFRTMIEEKVHVVGTSMALREVVIDAGMYDETLPTSEDFDLWLRIAHQGWRIVYNKQPLFRYRRRGGCLSDDQISFWSSFLRVMEKIERTMPLTQKEREIVEARCSYIKAMLSLYVGKQSFFAGETAKAIENLTFASEYFRTLKLSIVVWMLRHAPGLMLNLYQARDRLMFRKDTTSL